LTSYLMIVQFLLIKHFFFVCVSQLAGQIDMNRQSDLMAAFEEML
jgi:hypothetical protein